MPAGKLEGLDLFTKTFGKKFARRSYDLNVSRVYTNEENPKGSGYYSEEDHSINICASGVNGELLSIEDIENSEALQETTLHESVHGILEKSKKECKKLGIKSGTGMFEKYEGKEGKDKELGRGINEGLTNWIVSKTGMRTTGYPELTNIVRQIELAIGPEKTMRLAKGDIRNKIPKLLQMEKDECKEFIAKTDSFYDFKKKIREEERIISEHEKKLMEIEGESANYEDAKMQIANHIEERNKLVRESIDVLLDIEDTIYTKYFKKEFDELTKQDEIPREKLLKFINLRNLMHNHDRNNLGNVIDFQEKIDQMRRVFLDEKAYMIEAKANMGTLSISEFSETRELFERCGGSTWRIYRRPGFS